MYEAIKNIISHEHTVNTATCGLMTLLRLIGLKFDPINEGDDTGAEVGLLNCL